MNIRTKYNPNIYISMEQTDEMKSLNKDLLTEFTVKELENRLETDPLLIGNPIDASLQLSSDAECFICVFCFSCGDFL